MQLDLIQMAHELSKKKVRLPKHDKKVIGFFSLFEDRQDYENWKREGRRGNESKRESSE